MKNGLKIAAIVLAVLMIIGLILPFISWVGA
jgi:hypothetical protein